MWLVVAGAWGWLEKAWFRSLSQRWFWEKAQVGRRSCFYLEVSFKFQMIRATCALETLSAFLPEVAGTQPSPALREPW